MNTPNLPNLRPKEVNFPTTFNLKVIMETNETIGANERLLMNTLAASGVTFMSMDSKSSSRGKYVSYTIHITVGSREAFDTMYEKLTELPGVKTAI